MSKVVGLIINGTVELSPGDGERFAAIARQSMIDTEGSPGCCYYAFNPDLNRPNVFHFAEGWTNEEALKAHFRRPHFQASLRELVKLDFVARDITAYAVSGASDVPLPPMLEPSEFVD